MWVKGNWKHIEILFWGEEGQKKDKKIKKIKLQMLFLN